MRTDVTAATCPQCYAAVLRQTGGVAGQRRLMEGITEGEGRDARVRYVAHTCDPVILAQYAQAAAMQRYADAVAAILDGREAATRPRALARTPHPAPPARAPERDGAPGAARPPRVAEDRLVDQLSL